MAESRMAFWLMLITGIGVLAGAIALFVLFPSANEWHWQLKYGLALCVAGLLVQLMRTLYFSENGQYPKDLWFPMWALKDVGISILIYYFTFNHKKTTNT